MMIEAGMTRQDSQTTASVYTLAPQGSGAVSNMHEFRSELRDRKLWSGDRLEKLIQEIDEELERRENAQRQKAEAPPAKAVEVENKPAQEASKPISSSARNKQSSANDNLSFEEALRREVADFQQHYRSGVMSGR
jgi:sensor domain CHASE-containing protein